MLLISFTSCLRFINISGKELQRSMIPLWRTSCHMEKGITWSDVMTILTPLPSSDVNNLKVLISM